MSRLWVRTVLWSAVFVAVCACLAVGIAGAVSVQSGLDGALQPSAVPALLGPITESGRKGWACKPEQAAAARRPKDAELPDATPR